MRERAEMSDERPDWLTGDGIADIQRDLAARTAWETRNNRYGNMSAYLSHALEVMCGADPQVSSKRLLSGAKFETLLDENAPIDDPAVARLRAEVRDLYARLDDADSPSEMTIAAVDLFGRTLGFIEQCLLDG